MRKGQTTSGYEISKFVLLLGQDQHACSCVISLAIGPIYCGRVQ